ncbi:MAG TPA: TonB-dependent receptor [Ohtaekwangia sp.]|nr:TonB-dependent receptor [Ohtaekwangia sp.]
MRKKMLLALCGLLSAWLASAQDSLRQTLLQEVVVSATRTEQPVIEIPRSVSVITSNTIEKSVFNSVGELLGSQEGVYVVGNNQTPGSNQGLFMRGANSNQVVVMIDGIRIMDPSSPNAAVDLSEISLANVERIEIIRGSHSTIYGGSAIGGVVNIITRKNGHAGLHGNASLQAATFGHGSSAFTETIDLRYSLKRGFYVVGSVINQHVNGLDATIKEQLSPGAFTTRDADDFRKTDGAVKLGFKTKKWDNVLSFKRTDQRAYIDDGAFADDDNNYLDFKRNLFDYRVGYTINSHVRINAIGSWSDMNRFNENDSSVIDDAGTYDQSYFRGRYRGNHQTHELQLNFDGARIHGVAGGGLFRDEMTFDTYFFSNAFGPFESVVNYDSLDVSSKTVYAFGELRYTLGKFGISGGTRFSHHSRFGSYSTFELNPSYQVDQNLLLYLSYATGYNAPSLYQLFDPTKDFGSYASRGNRDLDAEESVSYEAGVKKEFSNGSFFTVSAFTTTVRNAIEYIYLWNSGKAQDDLDFADYRGDRYINIGQQHTKGFECSSHIVIGRAWLQGNFTWTTGRITIRGQDLKAEETGGNHVQLYNFGSFLDKEFKGNILSRRPRLMASVQTGYRITPPLVVTAGYRFAGARYDPGYEDTLGPFGALSHIRIGAYSLVDIGVNWEALKNLSLAFKVENIFDQRYQEIAGFQTRGRSGYIKLVAKW